MLKNSRYNSIATATTFIWIGFVCAISFMEAWLKFQAPGIDTRLGVGIGKLVFAALNKVEITALLVIMICSINYRRYFNLSTIPLVVLSTILAIQTFWLLPQLSIHADLLIDNGTASKSYHHILYVLLEVLKIIALLTLGIGLFMYRVSKPFLTKKI
ncbi:hypothetical protein [Flagellimonas flava]|uniref:DUF4149 domain-containing protein n=1 Tax=Flagellimonas flava TaxID=570519 RepID=A0A1M5K5E0_9FLAO|nr:hypothetical protein [Allomuricauda flava]SHG48038.1 hypothetical protein SAMN04488116_1394 [Allomuricauda flava]